MNFDKTVYAIKSRWGVPCEVGRYGRADKDPQREKSRSSIPCPYCHTPMWSSNHGAHRIIAIVGEDERAWKTLVQMVPTTHVLLQCEDCKLYFTSLRKQSEPS